MSFSFDRPNLRERSRGKSGDEFLEEIMKNMNKKNRNFFDSHPRWKTTGFTFDDGLEREGSAGGSRSNLQAHLADLVARHPEFADTFVGLLPEDQPSNLKENKQSSEASTKDSNQQRSKVHNIPQTTTQGTQTGSLESDIKLRNTIGDMQSTTTQHSGETDSDNDRAQRSQSAPPQTSPSSKKEEGIRLIPIKTDDVSHPAQQIPARPQQQHYQNPPFSHQNSQHQQFSDQRNHDERSPVVRHIPIYVEGRDEPILPKDAASSCTKRGGCQGKAESAPGKRGTQPKEKCQQQQVTNEQPQQQQAPPQSAQPPPKPDALTQVAEILKEVEELAARVNNWKGASRSEKEYIYLDEMLTRNLLKLDNIETEGKEEVRTARKDVIRRIQTAICVLESKSTDGSEQSSQIQCENDDTTQSSHTVETTSQTEPMETDETSEFSQASQSSQT